MSKVRSKKNQTAPNSASKAKRRVKSKPLSGSRRTANEEKRNIDLDPFTKHLLIYAEAEEEALAFATIKCAKQGHKRSLECVHDSLARGTVDQSNQDTARTQFDIGTLETLEEIADAQRRVLTEAAVGHLGVADASRIMGMLIELRQTILNFDIPKRLDELEAMIQDAL